jgi:hypothetical protein
MSAAGSGQATVGVVGAGDTFTARAHPRASRPDVLVFNEGSGPLAEISLGSYALDVRTARAAEPPAIEADEQLPCPLSEPQSDGD